MTRALLVIDIQRGLVNGAADIDAVIDRVNALSARAREGGALVVMVQHERPGTVVERGSDGWRFHEALEVAGCDRVVAKTTPDSFLGTTLSELLDGAGVDQLVICGYASEFCVDTTVRRAAALGYGVMLVADAHTTHDKAHASAERIRLHENSTLPDITSFDGDISTEPAADVRFESGGSPDDQIPEDTDA